MKLWLDAESASGKSQIESSEFVDSIDPRIGIDIFIDEGKLLDNEGKIIGAHVIIDDEHGQTLARSTIGSGQWLLVECRNWTIIPLENLIADADSTPTSIAVKINDSKLISGAAFALEIGVDAIVLGDDLGLWEQAAICKAHRLSKSTAPIIHDKSEQSSPLQAVKIIEIQRSITGDRVCVDFTKLLRQGEGMLVGSSSSMMALIHGETLESGYVPPRPFRVNAGAVHSYCIMGDGKTKYLSEVHAGDNLRVHDSQGNFRILTVGRVKIEHRPLIILKMSDENAHTGSVCLQQAETVRLVVMNGQTQGVNELMIDDLVMARFDSSGRHVGSKISAKVTER